MTKKKNKPDGEIQATCKVCNQSYTTDVFDSNKICNTCKVPESTYVYQEDDLQDILPRYGRSMPVWYD